MAKTVGKKLGALFGALMAAGTATKANAHDHDHDVQKTPSTPDAAQTFESGIEKLDVSQLEPLPSTTIERFEDVVDSFEKEGGHSIYLFSPQSILERLPNTDYKRADQFGRSDYVAFDTEKAAEAVLSSVNEYTAYKIGNKYHHNTRVANLVANGLADTLSQGVADARADIIEGFRDRKTNKVCFAQFNEGQTKTEFISQFSQRKSVNVSFMTTQEAQDWIIAHELEHCRSLTETRGHSPEIHSGEGVADSFAYAINVQQNGINTDMIEGIKAIRTLNLYDSAKQAYEHNQSIKGQTDELGQPLEAETPHTGHYTAPIINKAIPHIEEAYADGKLQRMSPYEVSQAVMAWSYGPENERAENIQNMTEHQKQLGKIAMSVYAFEKSGMVDLMSPAQKDFYETVQNARDIIERDPAEIDNMPYDEKRSVYENELRETMDLQDTAVEKLSVLTAKQHKFEAHLENLVDMNASPEDALAAERALFSRDSTGLTGEQRLEVLRDIRLETERTYAHELPKESPKVEQDFAPSRAEEPEFDR